MLSRAFRPFAPLLAGSLPLLAASSTALAQAAPFAPSTDRGANASNGADPLASASPSPSAAPADNATPRLLHFVPAEYPAEARAQNIEGAVLLTLTIDEHGRFSEATVS